MLITAIFYDTGLTPTIDIYDMSDDSLVVTGQAMSETGQGIYKYDFTAADITKDYSFRADAGVDRIGQVRYAYGTQSAELGEIANNVDTILKIEAGSWEINVDNGQLILYDTDKTTPLYTFNLFDRSGNQTAFNPVRRVLV